MSKFALPKQVRLEPTVLYQEIPNGSFLLDIQTESYYYLDKAGTRMWQLLAGHGGFILDVFIDLFEQYDVDEATLSHDLAVWLGELEKCHLITVLRNKN